MALKMTPDAALKTQTHFFEQVFGPTHATTKLVHQLAAHGVHFGTTLYGVSAAFKDQLTSVQLNIGTNALLKKTSVDPALIPANQLKIQKWVGDLAVTFALGNVSTAPKPVVSAPKPLVPTADATVVLTSFAGNLITAIKVVREITGLGLGEAKELVEKVKQGSPHTLVLGSTAKAHDAVAKLLAIGMLAHVAPVYTAEQKATVWEKENSLNLGIAALTPTSEIVPLATAKALGQKVRGSSGVLKDGEWVGTVYHCVATSAHIKIAARVQKSGAISLRAEWTGNPEEDLKKLQESGMVLKGHYGSMHLMPSTVPIGRTIGGWVLGVPIAWDQVIKSAAELIVE
jgi:ribosomal protein L7/L12